MAVEGHVLQASSSSKLRGVLVMAWPCGLATSTDALGAFRVSCPQGIDSLTLSCVGFDTQVVVSPASHVDVWMEDLNRKPQPSTNPPSCRPSTARRALKASTLGQA